MDDLSDLSGESAGRSPTALGMFQMHSIDLGLQHRRVRAAARVAAVLLVLGFAMVAFGRRRNPRNLRFRA
jgi:hypothetical protein